MTKNYVRFFLCLLFIGSWPLVAQDLHPMVVEAYGFEDSKKLQDELPERYAALCKVADHGVEFVDADKMDEENIIFLSHKRLKLKNPDLDFATIQDRNPLTISFIHDENARAVYKLPNGNYMICLSKEELKSIHTSE